MKFLINAANLLSRHYRGVGINFFFFFFFFFFFLFLFFLVCVWGLVRGPVIATCFHC